MRRIIYLFGILIFLTSCEKVIDLDLNDNEAKVVIEAELLNKPGSNFVKLSKSRAFYENNAFESISNATVTISDQNGQTWNLDEVSPGLYQHADLEGKPGTTYTLDVEVEGTAYMATSRMPGPVAIDSLVYEKFDGPVFGGSEGDFILRSYYSDPADAENYYRFNLHKNDTLLSNIFVSDDRLNNGISTFYIFFEERFNSGDNVKVEQVSVTKEIYKYFEVLAEAGEGGPASASPGNPDTNIEGGAIGYFNVGAKTEIEGFVP